MKNTLLYKQRTSHSPIALRAFLLLLMLVLTSQMSYGQTPNGFLDFGNFANNTAATALNTGFSTIRVGTGGGGFTLPNPGQTIGTLGEFRGTASTNASVNAAGVVAANYGTAAALTTTSFEIHLSTGNSGAWYFMNGNGTNTTFPAALSQAFAGNEVFTGLRWTFGGGTTITTAYRNGGVWTNLAANVFAKNNAYYVTIVGNNTTASVNYGVSESVLAGTYDLWINGILVGNNLAKAQLANSTTINAFKFYGENSPSNNATIALDNIRWYNTCVLPATHLALINVPTTGTKDANLSSYTVQARSGSASGPLASSFTEVITVAKVSGSGAISGTLAQNAVAGVATYSNTQFDAAASYTINATSVAPIINSAPSAPIVIGKATPILVTAPTASAITYLQTLESSTLSSGVASVPGTFTFTTPSIAPNVGTGSQGVTFTPTDSANYNTFSTTVSVIVNKATPIITPTIGSYTYNGFEQGPNAATSASTGARTFSYVGVSPTVYTASPTPPVNAGSYAVTVSVATDDNYLAATSAATAFTIAKSTPAATLAVSNSPVVYNAEAQTATVNVTASSVAGTVTNVLVGGAASQTDAGTYAVKATFVPNDAANYESLTEVSAGNFIINKSNQIITAISTTENKVFGDASYSVATTASSGLTVTYSSSNPLVATVDSSGIVTIEGAGSTTIVASQGGNANFNPATNVTQALTVAKANQTITAISTTENKVFGDASYGVATTASSGLTVTYSSSNPLVATVDSSGIVTIEGAGATSITASQAGDDNYFAATDVTQDLIIDKATLLITADSQLVCSGTDVSDVIAAGTSTATGFVYSEDESVISGITTYTTTYTSATAAGTAGIVITPVVNQLSAANYEFSLVLGAITIDASSTNTITICEYDTYTWAVNNQTYTASGSYSAVVPNCVTEVLNLTIIPKPKLITQPVSPTICNFPGSSATITVGVQSTLTPSYSWYSQLADSTDWILLTDDPTYQGTGTSSLTITKTILTIPDFGFKYFPLPGTKFKVEIAAGGCAAFSSNEVVLNEVVMSSPRGISAVELLTPRLTICSGSTVDLRLALQSVGDIQWQSSIDNVNWTNEGALILQSAVSAANPILYFTSGILTQDTWFRVIATNGICGPILGEATKINVSSPPVAGTITGGDVTVCTPLGSGLDITGVALTEPITNNTILTLTNPSNFDSIVWERSTNYVNDANVAVWTSVVNFVGTPLSVAYSGAGTTELIIGNLAVTTYYRAVVTNGACTEYSNIVKITVSPTAKIGLITSSSTSICHGEDITFTSTAITGNSFRWEISTTSSLSGYSTIDGATGLQFVMQDVTNASATGKFYIRTVAIGDCNSAISRVLTITVNPVAVAGVVTGGGSVCSNSNGSLSVSTQVGTILQWESSSNGVDYVNVATGLATAGATYISGSATGSTSRYLVTNITADTFFRVKTTSGTCSEAYSNVIKYEVVSDAVAGTISTETSTICAGTGATLTLNNSVGTIIWKKSINWTSITPTWTTVSSTSTTPITNNRTTLGTGNLLTTTAYQATVTIGSCSVVLSNIQIITVNPAPKGGTVAVNTLGTTICSGGSKAMKVTGAVGSIQWQRSTTSALAGFEDVAGATVTPYTFENITAPTWFRVVATNGVCSNSVASAAVEITVTTTPAVAGTISGNQSLCRSNATSLFLSGSSGTIVWQRATVVNGIIGTFANVIASTIVTITNDGLGGSILNTGNLIATTAYRVMLTSGSCVEYTPTYIVSVSPLAKVTSISGFNTVSAPLCIGDTATLSLAAGQVGTIEWLSSTTLTGVYSPILGATSSIYNYTPTSAGTLYFKVRMTSSPCSTQATTVTGVAVFATSCSSVSSKVSVSKISKEPFNVKAYPNPFTAALQLDFTTTSKNPIEMKVYDMTGKVVEVRQFSAAEMNHQEVGNNYSLGIYNLIVTQGAQVKTVRVIKK